MHCGEHALRTIIALALLVPILGCSSEEPESAVLPAPAPAYAPPPQYASAEALLEHCQALLDQEPQDLSSFLDEIYYENADQQLFRDYVDSYLRPKISFYHTLLDYFGDDSVIRKNARNYRITIPSDARVNHSQPGRADSILVWIMNNRPTECTMQMVEIDGRWWISGYAIEPVLDALVRADFQNSKPNLRAWIDQEFDSIRSEYQRLESRVLAREFGNAYEAIQLEIHMLANHGMSIVYQ